MQESANYPIELLPLRSIHPTEEHSCARAADLASEIAITSVWTRPVLVDTNRGALMDGHHRFEAACRLGLALVPAIRLSYADPAVSLKSWRPEQSFAPEDIWAICDHGRLLPMKSTRHVVRAQLPDSRVPLDWLRDPTRAHEVVTPAAPHPSRVQMLRDDYHAFGAHLGLRTLSAARLDVETPVTLLPHAHLRHQLETDPAMAALLPGAPCRIALGRHGDFPFRLRTPDLLALAPALLESPAALAVAARWGIEAAFALEAGQMNDRRLVMLVRHGTALVRQLAPADRALLLDGLPEITAAELAAGPMTAPSAALLAWFADLIGQRSPTPAAVRDAPLLPLEAPIEVVLVSNSDSRLCVDPATGKNRYGTTPRPRPEAVHFSSSTASSISDYGFLYCDALRRDLLNHLLDGEVDIHALRAGLSDAVLAELRQLCNLDPHEADGVLAPSGTDTEVIAVLMARAAAPDAPLVNILISPEETGRGVKLAAAGRYFDDESATGAAIEKGGEIWPGAPITLVDLPIRDAAGVRLDPTVLDAAVLQAGRSALDQGARVLAHVLYGSKTGLSGPSDRAIETLVALAPDRVDVVADACQMRVDPVRLADCVRRGWMVQISGSKALTGPPFSGAILFPPAWRDRLAGVRALMRPAIGYTEDWVDFWSRSMGRGATTPAFGAPMRWIPALCEAKLLRHVPHVLRRHITERFRHEVTERLQQSPNFSILSREEEPDAVGDDGEFARHSIISFQVLACTWEGRREALDEPRCRRIFELLNQDARRLVPRASRSAQAVLRQEFHIGQPVMLGSGASSRAVLRLVIGMRFFNIVAHAGPGSIAAALESEIADLMRAIDKLEILAENWPTYAADVL